MNARKINNILELNCEHCLYRVDGKWYHHLKRFPGILFDKHGFILFRSERDYLSSPYLQHGKDLNVLNGISSIPGYIKFSVEQERKLSVLTPRNTFFDNFLSWPYLLRMSRIYIKNKEVFYNRHGQALHLSSVTREVITITIKTNETISQALLTKMEFESIINTIRTRSFPLRLGVLSKNETIEALLVELHPKLNFDDQKLVITFDESSFLEEPWLLEEVANDDINSRSSKIIKVRRGQKKFRQKLLTIYGGKCAITGCDVKYVLNACHLDGFAQTGNNISTNAILLRSDVHDLFDENLIAIHPKKQKVFVHEVLKHTSYFEYNGQDINVRKDGKLPDSIILKKRWRLFLERTGVIIKRRVY